MTSFKKNHIFTLVKTLVFILSTNICLAQIAVGPIEQVKSKAGEFDLMDLKKLEKSQTIFFYRPSDDVEMLKKVFDEVWTITEVTFEPYSKLSTMNLNGKSFFSLAGFNTKVTNLNSGFSYDNTHIYLRLGLMGKNKRGKPEVKSFCRIDLHPSGDFYGKMPKTEGPEGLDFVYKEGVFRNWQPGFLKNQLQVVNKLLDKNAERWLFENETKNSEVKKLATNTLYVVDYAMLDFNKFNGDESKKLDEEKLFKSYSYKYELISAEELSNKILDSSEPFYYLAYLRSSTDKYITIYNSQTGSIVYTKYSPASYTMKSDDLKDLAKSIEK